VTAILTVLGVLIFGLPGAIVLVLMFGNEDTDVPEAAEAPDEVERAYAQTGAAFGFPVAYVKSDHPESCLEKCCIDIRVHDFDWHAYEHEMGSKR
jgi:hypothetical protein